MRKFLVLILLLTLDSRSELNEPITPLPVGNLNLDMGKVNLGNELFHEKSLSRDNTISCSSCHNLQQGGADTKVFSQGINGLSEVNTPTVFNSGFNFRQFWNGGAETLEEQINGPILNPKEMGSTWDDVIRKLKANQNYVTKFSDLYQNGITKENIQNAIATFERSLVTTYSKFDRYLNGDQTSLTSIEKIGYGKFKSYGCISCHQGMNVGGNMYQTMGIMGDYFKDRGTPITETDLGRYAITNLESDKYVFRVPSLRNVALTAPYFHDGSAKTLDSAVKTMAKYQLGRQLTEEDASAIVAFLNTLTGQLPATLKGNSN